MDQRPKVGLEFSYNEEWIAGSYYIINLIKALKELSNDKKPFLQIYCNSLDESSIIQAIGYPFIKFTYTFIDLNIVNLPEINL